jgi:hypothetical protein
VFKLGKRTALLPHAASAWSQLHELHTQQQQQQQTAGEGVGSSGVGGVLARKLTIKLAQRVALTFLTPRLAPWRYQRGDGGRDVEVRLGAGGQELAVGAAVAVGQQEVVQGQQLGREEQLEQEEEEEEEFELVEEVEEVGGARCGMVTRQACDSLVSV